MFPIPSDFRFLLFLKNELMLSNLPSQSLPMRVFFLPYYLNPNILLVSVANDRISEWASDPGAKEVTPSPAVAASA